MDYNVLRRELSTFSHLLKYVMHYKSRLLLAVVCSAVVSVLGILLISLLKPTMAVIFEPEGTLEPTGRLGTLLTPLYILLEYYAGANPLHTLVVVCCCILFIVALNGIFRYLQEYMVKWIGNRVILDLQRDLYLKMTRFNAAYFASRRVGSLISYFTVDIRVIGMTIFYVFGRLLLDPLQLLATVIFLLFLQWKLTLIYAAIFPLIFYIMRYYAGKNRRAGREAQHILARLGAFLQEHFTHIRLVQVYNMYDHQQKRFWDESRGVFSAIMSMAKATAASSPINEFLGLFALCCILMLGGYMIFSPGNAGFKAEDFVVYIATLAAVYQPVKRLERTVQEIQVGFAAAERVFEVLNTNAEVPELPHAQEVHNLNQSIRFENVSFSYDDKTRVLDSISFDVRKGEQIALVGPSGAGKTTLVHLIPRFYDPSEGRLLMDEVDFRSIQLESLRRLISFVSQDIMIFGDTVWMNLTCGDESYQPEDVYKAAHAAYADRFIESLPEGYQTVVGERGLSLSGGQCQRLAIARAFLRDTPIIIFDEATSSLDSESEQHIKRSMHRLMEGRTTFIIAHRLSTILQADKIIVLEHGRKLDMGTHHELLERCDLYQRLYRLQFHEGDPDALTPSTQTMDTP